MKTLGVVASAGLIVFLAGLCFAAAPVGSASGTQTFHLRGNAVPVAGVPSWPLVAGDEISTDSGFVTLRFRDGSEATLDKGSRAKIEQDGDHLILRLQSGAMQFQVAKNSTLRVLNLNNPVAVNTGVVKTISTRPGPTPVIRPVTAGFTLPGISGSR